MRRPCFPTTKNKRRLPLVPPPGSEIPCRSSFRLDLFLRDLANAQRLFLPPPEASTDQENGQAELDQWLSEMKRVLRKDGMIILFESLGTGNEEPIRLEHVESTYQWLDANGFVSKWIRTDYQFECLEEAQELSRFFFGDELGAKVERNQWVVLPECTGVGWRKV